MLVWALSHRPRFVYSLSLLTMPSKPLSQLTQDEEKLLLIAAQMMGALGERAVSPPTTPAQVEYWNSCMKDDLVHTHLSTMSSLC